MSLELMLVGVIKVPDGISSEGLARLEAELIGHINLDALDELWPDKKPLIWWQFVKLVAPIGN